MLRKEGRVRRCAACEVCTRLHGGDDGGVAGEVVGDDPLVAARRLARPLSAAARGGSGPTIIGRPQERVQVAAQTPPLFRQRPASPRSRNSFGVWFRLQAAAQPAPALTAQGVPQPPFARTEN